MWEFQKHRQSKVPRMPSHECGSSIFSSWELATDKTANQRSTVPQQLRPTAFLLSHNRGTNVQILPVSLKIKYAEHLLQGSAHICLILLDARSSTHYGRLLAVLPMGKWLLPTEKHLSVCDRFPRGENWLWAIFMDKEKKNKRITPW